MKSVHKGVKKNYDGTESDKLHTIRFEIYQNGMKMLQQV